MRIGILDYEAAYSSRRTGGEMKPYRRAKIMKVKVERRDFEPRQQFVNHVREACE
jgi:hypothetical protein